MEVEQLTDADRDAVVGILKSSFYDYPVFRYILQDSPEEDYPVLLDALVTFYTDLRYTRGYPVLGTRLDGELISASLVNPPESKPWPPKVIAAARQALGEPAWTRMAEYEERAAGPEPDAPHFYIGMIGTRPGHQGTGHGSAIVDTVEEMSREHSESTGVYLTTETEGNVFFYRRKGYTVVDEVDVDGVHGWCMFCPTPSLRDR